MLTELYMMQTYFEEPGCFALEDELHHRYGGAAIREAVKDGLLERKRIPCGTSERWVCRLSALGEAAMRQRMTV